MGSTSSGAATSAPAYAGAFFRQAPVTIGAPPTVTVTNAQPGAPAPSGADAYLPAMQERLATVTREDAAKFVGLMFGKFEKFCNEEGVAVGGYPLTLFGNPTGLRVSVSTSGTSRIATLVLPPDTDAKGRPKLALALYKATEHKLQYGGLSDDYNVRAAIQAYIYSLARLDDESPRSRKPTKRLTAGDDGPYAREVVAKPVPVSATTERMGASEKSTSARKLSIELADGQWQVCCRASGCERLTEVKKADELTANRCSRALCNGCLADSTKIKAAQPAAQARRKSGVKLPPKKRAREEESDEEGDEEPPPREDGEEERSPRADEIFPPERSVGDEREGGAAWSAEGNSFLRWPVSHYFDARGKFYPCRPKGGDSNRYYDGEVVLWSKADSGNEQEDMFWVQYKDEDCHEMTTIDVQRGMIAYGGRQGRQWLELKLQLEIEREQKEAKQQARLRAQIAAAKAEEETAAKAQEEKDAAAAAAEDAAAAARRAVYEASAKRRRLEQQQRQA